MQVSWGIILKYSSKDEPSKGGRTCFCLLMLSTALKLPLYVYSICTNISGCINICSSLILLISVGLLISFAFAALFMMLLIYQSSPFSKHFKIPLFNPGSIYDLFPSSSTIKCIRMYFLFWGTSNNVQLYLLRYAQVCTIVHSDFLPLFLVRCFVMTAGCRT